MPLFKGASSKDKEKNWKELWAKYKASGSIHGDKLNSDEEAKRKIAAITLRIQREAKERGKRIR